MSLATEARPQSLDGFFGNDGVKESLNRILTGSDLETHPHSYMFQGPSGCGKTTLARIMAEVLGCKPHNIIEFNAAGTRGIDTVRDDIVPRTMIQPIDGGPVAFILDECQSMTAQAQECLLKPLEDCPDFVYFFLCTTDPDSIKKTVRNRCTTFALDYLSNNDIIDLLMAVTDKYNISCVEYGYEAIVMSSGGCPRTAVQMLEAIRGISEKTKIDAVLVTMGEYNGECIAMCRMLVGRGTMSSFDLFKKLIAVYKAIPGKNTESIRRQMLGYFGACLKNVRDIRSGRLFSSYIKCLSNADTLKGGDAQLVAALFEMCSYLD